MAGTIRTDPRAWLYQHLRTITGTPTFRENLDFLLSLPEEILDILEDEEDFNDMYDDLMPSILEKLAPYCKMDIENHALVITIPYEKFGL